MNQRESKLCRLCLRTISNENFEDGEIIAKILEVLQLKLKFHIDKDHVVCSNCMGSIQKCLDFKSTYLDAEDSIVPLYNFETESKLHLREVYVHKYMAAAEIDAELDICRLCIKLNKRSSCKPLIEIQEDMLQKCIPELNFNLTKEPVICDSCLKSLKLNYQFLRTCMDTEEKIIKYFTFAATDSKGQINLNRIVEFTKNILEYERSITKVNVDLDGLYRESNKNNVIKTEITVKNESAEFERENVANDIKPDVEEIIKLEINEDSLKLQDGELKMIYEQNVDLDRLHCESKENNEIKIEIIVENENAEFDRENVENGNKTDVEEIKMIEINEDSLKLQNGELEMICEQNGLQTKQTNFESFQDDPTSSQSIMKNSNIRNSNDHVIHQLHQEISEATVYACETCSYTTYQEIDLGSHKLIHESSQIKLHHCYQCSYKTKYKRYLKSHMWIHRLLSEVTVYYKCQSCPYVAEHEKDRNIHMRIHASFSEVTVYNCLQCSFKTSDKVYLKSHMLIHRDPSEVTLYKCAQCMFKTKYKLSLKRHLLVHREVSEAKLYNCDECAFNTNYKTSLKAHIAAVHRDFSEVTVYNCAQCSFKSKYKKNLKEHMFTHQKVVEVELYK